MTRAARLSLALALATVPAAGQALATPAPAASETTATPAPPNPALRDEQRARDKAELEIELLHAQQNWFAILFSVVVGLFGTLVTASVIFFSLRFGRQAVAEARQAAFDEVAAQKAEVEREVAAARQSRAEVEQLVAEIRRSNEEASTLLRGMQPGERVRDPATQRKVEELAEAAELKPRATRTADEYRALINQAAAQEDWPSMLRRAQAMAYLFERGDPHDASWALQALGVAQMRSGDPAAAERTFDSLIERFAADPSMALREEVLAAQVNRAEAMAQAGRADDALAALTFVVDRYAGVERQDMIDQLARAWFQLACLTAARRDAPATIAHLRHWARANGSFDCEAIAQEKCLDPIRAEPAFIALLREMGCN